MDEEQASSQWAEVALDKARRELNDLDVQIQKLALRRSNLVDTVQSLTVLVELTRQAADVVAAEGDTGDVYTKNMARYMRNQALHFGGQVNPPKRRQDFDSSTIRVLRIVAETAPDNPAFSAGDIVGLYTNQWRDTDSTVITQAIRRNVGYGFLVELRLPSRAKVYGITDSGRAAIEEARAYVEFRNDEMRAKAEAEEGKKS